MARRVRIKICGITRPQDAVAAADAGADAIGMILHAVGRPRQIKVDAAKEILAALPPMISAVGVFLDAPIDLIVETAKELRLRYVQLHGSEMPQQIASLGDLQVIKAIRLGATTETWRNAPPQLRAFLIESGPGGSGIESDWHRLAIARHENAILQSRPLIAAGGLTTENVAQVIRLVRPWAVDVSSGVEESVGNKSAAKIAAFCQAAQSVEMGQ